MKALLLAAGLGTRLRPLTDDNPKCLLNICGKPLLYIWLDKLENEDINEVIINTHFFPEKVNTAIQNRKNKIKVTILNEKYLLGTGGTIYSAKKYLQNEKDFFIIYADNLTNASLKNILRFHNSFDSVFTTYVYKTDKPKEKGIFLIDEQTGKVLEFEEKPQNPKSTIANAGIGILKNDIYNYLTDKIPLDFSKEIIPLLLNNMYVLKSDLPIFDIGTMKDYKNAQNYWQKLIYKK